VKEIPFTQESSRHVTPLSALAIAVPAFREIKNRPLAKSMPVGYPKKLPPEADFQYPLSVHVIPSGLVSNLFSATTAKMPSPKATPIVYPPVVSTPAPRGVHVMPSALVATNGPAQVGLKKEATKIPLP
jgi:hypothetical protein